MLEYCFISLNMEKVVEAEADRVGVKVRVVKKQLFRPEVGQEQCGAPDCLLDMGQGGGHHHRSGCLYRGTCLLCRQQGVKAEYVGESGFSGYTRNLAHLSAIRMDKPGSFAMAAQAASP